MTGMETKTTKKKIVPLRRKQTRSNIPDNVSEYGFISGKYGLVIADNLFEKVLCSDKHGNTSRSLVKTNISIHFHKRPQMS